MKKNSFIFFGELVELKKKDEIELFDNYILKKANKDQIEIIQNFISDYTKILHYNVNRYEYYSVPNDNCSTFYPLDKKDWKYWVIEYPQVNPSNNAPLALALAKIDLTILFSSAYTGIKSVDGKEVSGVVSHQLKTLNFFYNTPIEELKSRIITQDDLKEIKALFKSLKRFEEKARNYEFIKKALQDFMKLQEVPKSSPFRVLGYFSIMELLLTNYKPNENSINNQLQTKINLVNNKVDNSINFREYFGGADTNTLEAIIAKLYQYRNDIAHGNKSDFEKQLNILKNNKSLIQEFLRDLTKLILVFAINESELVSDLKKC